MSIRLTLLLMCILPGVLYAQQKKPVSRNDTILYLCINNRLKIPIDKKYYGKILVSTDNGKVEQYNDGSYYIFPERVGRATVHITFRNEKKAGIALYTVERLPVLIQDFGKEISKKLLMARLGLTVHLVNIEIDARLQVVGYTTRVSRKGRDIYSGKQTDAYFSEVTKDFFKTLQDGDIVNFEDVIIKDCDGVLRSVGNNSCTIKDAALYHVDTASFKGWVIDPVTGVEYEIK